MDQRCVDSVAARLRKKHGIDIKISNEICKVSAGVLTEYGVVLQSLAAKGHFLIEFQVKVIEC